MKKLICLMFVSLVMLFSCSKDMLTDVNPDVKNAKVPIPFKGEMCMTYNYNVPLMPVANTPVVDPSSGKVLIPKLYLAGQAWLAGHATHIGEYIEDQSILTGIHAELDMAALLNDKKVVLVAEHTAVITRDNGDQIYLSSHIRIDATDPSNRTITGDWTLTGGSGKFENVTGSGTLIGILPCWDYDGTLDYPE